MRWVLRGTGILLALAGSLTLLWAFAVWQWQDPITLVLNKRAQSALSSDYAVRVEREQTLLRPRPSDEEGGSGAGPVAGEARGRVPEAHGARRADRPADGAPHGPVDHGRVRNRDGDPQERPRAPREHRFPRAEVPDLRRRTSHDVRRAVLGHRQARARATGSRSRSRTAPTATRSSATGSSATTRSRC